MTIETPMRRPWIDSHAHLNLFDAEDLPAAVERAAGAGVALVIVPATGPKDFERSLSLGRRYPGQIRIALGVHPHEASALSPEVAGKLEEGLEAGEVVALGEIGLDYHYMNSPRAEQIRALEWQLDLAIERDLPVILHNRESWEDMKSILSRREGRLRGVCHSFTESPERVAFVEGLGLFVGVSGMVSFKQAANIREMAAAISPDRLLLETDSPFLAPVPHRGKRNEPAYVPLVGEALARVRGIGVEEVAALTRANTCRLFGIALDTPGGVDG